AQFEKHHAAHSKRSHARTHAHQHGGLLAGEGERALGGRRAGAHVAYGRTHAPSAWGSGKIRSCDRWAGDRIQKERVERQADGADRRSENALQPGLSSVSAKAERQVLHDQGEAVTGDKKTAG